MTNPYFNQTTDQPEQRLLEDLVEEAISIHGVEFSYLPRRFYSIDGVLAEDAQAYFDTSRPFDAYVKNADKFGGDGTFLSQFGIEVRDRIELTISRRHWAIAVGTPEDLERPREGDLVYFTPNKRMFEVRSVERFEMDYPLGALPVWELTCELIEAGSQRFSTGVPEIDAFEAATSEDIFRASVQAANGAPIRTAEGAYWIVDSRDESATDPLDESQSINTGADSILDFSEADPFSDNAY